MQHLPFIHAILLANVAIHMYAIFLKIFTKKFYKSYFIKKYAPFPLHMHLFW
jgi:hypothetical protein